MAISKDDILEAVSSMSVIELNDLVKAFEEKFGVSAAALSVAAPAGGGSGAAAAEEKTEFNVVLTEAVLCRIYDVPRPSFCVGTNFQNGGYFIT